MDWKEIERRAEAALRVEVPVDGGRSFTLRLPTRHDKHKAMAAVAPDIFAAETARELTAEEKIDIARVLLERAVVGWQGVKLGDLLPDEASGEEPLPWSRAAVPLLLAMHEDWADALQAAFGEAMRRRSAPLEVDEKN